MPNGLKCFLEVFGGCESSILKKSWRIFWDGWRILANPGTTLVSTDYLIKILRSRGYYQVPNNRTVMNPYFRYIFQPLLFLFRALFLCHPMQVTGMLRLLPRTFLPPCSRIIRDGSFSFCNFLKSEILLFALAFSSTNIYVALYYGHHVLCLT